MLFRDKNGGLIEIVRANFTTDIAYYTSIINSQKQAKQPAFYKLDAETRSRKEQKRAAK